MAASSRGTLLRIAERLKEARAAKYPSASQAAHALKMNPVTVRAHESGQNGIPADVFMEYCNAYGVDIGWLMSGISTLKLDFSKSKGLSLPVSKAIKLGAYLAEDTDGLRPSERTVDIPGGDNTVLGAQVFVIHDDHAEPVFCDGTYLFVVSADRHSPCERDIVIIQRNQNNLIELTVRRIIREKGRPRAATLDFFEIIDFSDSVRVRGVVTASYSRHSRHARGIEPIDVPTVELPDEPLGSPPSPVGSARLKP